jgi:hypothetical protein
MDSKSIHLPDKAVKTSTQTHTVSRAVEQQLRTETTRLADIGILKEGYNSE